MSVPTREPPSPHFGDPSGPHWSAFPPPGREDADDEPVEIVGVLRFRMPEDAVDFPLWDDHGLLPEEPELLHEQLGLSLSLVADLMDWGRAWNAADRGEAGRTAIGLSWCPRRRCWSTACDPSSGMASAWSWISDTRRQAHARA